MIGLMSGGAEGERANVGRPTEPVRLELDDLYCILQIEPNDSLIALELARRLERRGRLNEAARILKAVVKIDYRFETLHALAQVEYQVDLLEDAFRHLQEAILIADEGHPRLYDLFKTLGNIFLREGDLDSAEDNYNKAFRLKSECDVLCVNLGSLAIQRRNWDEAIDHFRQALRLNRRNDKAWVGLALGHRVKGDHELSWGNLEAALEYNPVNEVALTLALEWGAQESREFRALELIRKFLLAGGWSEKFSLAFVWLSFRRGDRAVAALELERLLAVNPGHEHGLALAQDMRFSND